MIKYTVRCALIAFVAVASLQAAEEVVNQPDQQSEIATEVAETLTDRSFSERIDLIIQKLENGFILMESTRQTLIPEDKDNLANIYEAARTLVVKLLALTQVNKLADFGVEKEQALRLFKTYTRFKKKFVGTLPLEEAPTAQAEAAPQN